MKNIILSLLVAMVGVLVQAQQADPTMALVQALQKASDETRINVNECNLSLEAIQGIEFYRNSGLPYKIKYVSLKGILSESNMCLQLDLLAGEHANLARSLMSDDNAGEKAIDVINEFLAL